MCTLCNTQRPCLFIKKLYKVPGKKCEWLVKFQHCGWYTKKFLCTAAEEPRTLVPLKSALDTQKSPCLEFVLNNI